MPGNSGLRKREGEARKRDRRKEAAEALNHLHKFATTELQMEPISDGIREIKVRETEWNVKRASERSTGKGREWERAPPSREESTE